MRFISHAALLPSLMLSAPTHARAQQVPAGATVNVRLLDSLGSHDSFRGRTIRATVLAPVMVNGRVAIAPRAQMVGVVDDVGIERLSGARHTVHVRFTSLIPDSSSVPIDAIVSSVDNARETVDDDGRILGPPLASLIRSRAAWSTLILGSVDPVAGALLFTAVRGEAEERHRRVAFPPGTDMTLSLRQPATLPAWPVYAPPAALPLDATNVAVLTSLPARGLAAGGRGPGDFVNIMLLGSEAQLRAAFAAAGWDTPDHMSTRSDFETFVRAAAAEGYTHQPVSAQTMFGRDPDLVFQRVTDTFAKRHHVRIWRTDSTVAGGSVWLAAATHDIGVLVSREHRGFTHRVEDNIDIEREKLVGDLVAMNQVLQLGYWSRVTPGDDARGAFVSDWRVAIVQLK
ncbi:MAG: LssY C-terminal domain-containing protein [Gemmatimonadaceae bacterium]|nr:LssY C-terminal domain-containing protein [Gemmatimonadaceae bacterium]